MRGGRGRGRSFLLHRRRLRIMLGLRLGLLLVVDRGGTWGRDGAGLLVVHWGGLEGGLGGEFGGGGCGL